MRTWVLAVSGALAGLGLILILTARLLRRRTVPLVSLRRPVARLDQDEVRDLVAGRRDDEAARLLERRYRLSGPDARAVADDVSTHPDYPADWDAIARSLDDDLVDRVRRHVAAGRRAAAVRLVRLRTGLGLVDADRLVTAVTHGEAPRAPDEG